ncbi:MAG: YqhA family protein [Maribacter sp.]|nr:YqhA family protein [Maribacter sp.]
MKILIKLITGVPIISSLIIAIIFIGIGVYEIILGVEGILTGKMHTNAAPGVKLFLALDVFLIAFLFLIFSIGFTQLFIPKPSKIIDALDRITPEWLKVENFIQLKFILWDTALTTLVVMFVGEAYKISGEYDWKLIIVPIAILLISLSKYLLKKAHI